MRRFRRRREGTENLFEARPTLFVLLGSFLLYFLRFGYDYANSDQDEVLPYLLHHIDPGLFTQDWFVATQVSEFSVRTYFVWLLNAFALILPVWTATLLIYVVVWLLVAAAIYKLAFYFTGDQLAAVASVVVALVLTPVWTLGGNDLVHSMLVASMLAWALSLWAIYHFLRGRYLITPVLLGVACWMQALVGLHVMMLLVVLRTYRWIRREPGPNTLGGILVFGALFVLWSSPALGPLVYQQLWAQPADLNPGPSLFYILAEFRLPHHYLPGSFYAGSYVRFGALAALGLGSLLSVRYRRGIQEFTFIRRALVLIAMLCVAAAVFTEILPILFVAKLQLFKMTVLAKLFFVILICGGVAFWLPTVIRDAARAVLRRPMRGLAAITVLWIGVGAGVVMTDGYLHDLIGPFRRAEEPVGQVQAWVKRNTSTSAIFAVPPSFSTFRSETHRTIVINFKAVPYEDEQMIAWFRRLTDMAPIELPGRGGPKIMEKLDSAYAQLSASELRDLADRYRFEYVVRPAPLAPEAPATQPADTSEASGDTADTLSGADAPSAAAPVGGTAIPQDGTPADTLAAPAVPKRFGEVFRARDLYVYRLTAPENRATETQ